MCVMAGASDACDALSDALKLLAGPICSLSLGAPCVMQFRRGEACRALLLPARSLLIMAGESRLAWAHYIPSHKADAIQGETVPRGRRLSLTFRQVRFLPPMLISPCTARQRTRLQLHR